MRGEAPESGLTPRRSSNNYHNPTQCRYNSPLAKSEFHAPETHHVSHPANPTRRDAIKFLIAGAAAAACPVSEEFLSAGGAEPPEKLGSEENKVCHQVRDGYAFKFPPPSSECEVAIVGGGASGLIAAYRLRDTDFQLFEKEPRLGGNAISEQWRGVWYSTGAAYNSDEGVEALCRELGMEIHRIKSVDAAIINGQLVPEFWTTGLWKSPYPENVKKNFAAAQKDLTALDLEKNREKLDNMTFAELLKPYGPEVKAWFDNFGPNDWGATTENTSALIGADSLRWGGGLEETRFTWDGGLGRISLALEETIEKKSPERLHKGATALRVLPKAGKINVSYSQNGEIRTLAAKTAIIACPKFIAKHIIEGLDDAHLDAMDQMRYAPYLVVNVCFREVIYNGSYDTNIPAPSLIVDFNVADWVINRSNPETNRPSVLTCYVPRPEAERKLILKDAHCMEFGEQVVALLDTWFPGSRAKVEEVHLYRRGHPMYLSAPGVLTRIAPAIRKPMGNIFFAHSDSEGGVSEFSTALRAANRSSGEVLAALGKQAARSTTGAGS
jgi:protoporphyrinogen/coproporphyrinogen III oxidase